MFYANELTALAKSGNLRERKVFPAFDSLKDFASNDYLGLSNCADSLKKAYKLATNPKYFAPRASMLVNGYSKLHQMLETRLATLNGFESCILVGSGFLANIALIESLVRKGDKIFIDEEYHASGLLASKLVNGVEFFRHNDEVDLENKIRAFLCNSSLTQPSRELEKSALDRRLALSRTDFPTQPTNLTQDTRIAKSKNVVDSSDSQNSITKNIPRIIIAIEGIYSMSGDIAKKEFAQIALKYNAILIVDEAHSSSTLGANLLGYFDFHRIKIKPHFIKLGTFSKALGSYGAYICCSKHIYAYLQTRAKPIIYSTALSAFDSALALTNLNFIHKNRTKFRAKIQKIQKIIQKNLKIKVDSQIFSIQFQSQNEMLKTFRFLKKRGFFVGAIRKPSVKIPQLRIILSTKHNKKDIAKLCKLLKKHLKN